MIIQPNIAASCDEYIVYDYKTTPKKNGPNGTYLAMEPAYKRVFKRINEIEFELIYEQRIEKNIDE